MQAEALRWPLVGVSEKTTADRACEPPSCEELARGQRVSETARRHCQTRPLLWAQSPGKRQTIPIRHVNTNDHADTVRVRKQREGCHCHRSHDGQQLGERTCMAGQELFKREQGKFRLALW